LVEYHPPINFICLEMSHHGEYTMGAILIAGGSFAYLKKKSLPSLLGGVCLGAGYLTAGWLIHQKYEYTRGHQVAAICGATLATVGITRFAKTKAIFPAGMLAILGVVSLAGEAYFLTK
jgi:uncharacterized membrane protein (UPF0136 family)